MSLNFGIPRQASDVYTRPVALTAFAVTFAVIATFWWSHHRLFAEYFVPRRSTVFLNFVDLGLLVWLVYQLQLFVHFEGTPSATTAVVSYVLTYALVCLVHGSLVFVCVRIRWPELDAQERRRGVGSTGRVLSVALGTLFGLAIFLPLGWPEWAFLGIIVGQVLWRLTAPAIIKRLG